MTMFWIAAIIVVIATLALIAALAARPIAVAEDPSRTVYRRQLTEIDDMAARGLLGEDERKSAHAEAARRLLGEEDPETESTSSRAARPVIIGAGLLIAVAGIGAYLAVGQPGVPDQPYAERLAGWEAQSRTNLESMDVRQIVAILEQRKDEFPNDPELLAILADMQTRAGDPLSARRNLERAVELAPNEASYWNLLGQLEVDLAQGEITPRAVRALEQARALSPEALAPRYYLAQYAIEQGRIDEGLAEWRALLDQFPPEDRPALEERIAAVESGETAFERPVDPAVVAMVEGLAARLAEQPNDPDGWARLVRSYAVLGDDEALAAALAEARRIFRSSPRDLAAIEAAANVE
jgi:cytochrome c-type biogenesis protein CcmH